MADINKKWVAKQRKLESARRSGDPASLAAGRCRAGRSTREERCSRVAQWDCTPFQRRRTFKLEEQFKHFLNMFCKVHINTPLVESLQEIPRYAKLLREAVMRKKKPTKADLKLPFHCSEIIQREKAVK